MDFRNTTAVIFILSSLLPDSLQSEQKVERNDENNQTVLHRAPRRPERAVPVSSEKYGQDNFVYCNDGNCQPGTNANLQRPVNRNPYAEYADNTYKGRSSPTTVENQQYGDSRNPIIAPAYMIQKNNANIRSVPYKGSIQNRPTRQIWNNGGSSTSGNRNNALNQTPYNGLPKPGRPVGSYNNRTTLRNRTYAGNKTARGFYNNYPNSNNNQWTNVQTFYGNDYYIRISQPYNPAQSYYTRQRPYYGTTRPPSYVPGKPYYGTTRPPYIPGKPYYGTTRPPYIPGKPYYGTTRPPYFPGKPFYGTTRPPYIPGKPYYGTTRPPYMPGKPYYGTTRPPYMPGEPYYRTTRAPYVPGQQYYVTTTPAFVPGKPFVNDPQNLDLVLEIKRLYGGIFLTEEQIISDMEIIKAERKKAMSRLGLFPSKTTTSPDNDLDFCCPTNFWHARNETVQNLAGEIKNVVHLRQLSPPEFQFIPHGTCANDGSGQCGSNCMQEYRIHYLLVTDLTSSKSPPVSFDRVKVPGYCSCKIRPT